MNKNSVPPIPLLNNSCGLSPEEIRGLLERMLLIRYAETRIAQRVQEKKIRTPCHLYIGQEADAVGVCAVLRNTDYVFSTHRSHGHFLAKGGSLEKLFSEVYCRKSGCSGGRGGSMHLCDPAHGLLGSSSIVGGCLGIGLGPALKSKVLGLDAVSVVFHGDCVPEEGIWHESLNFAAIKKLPVIYVCENNLYAASSPLEERRIYDNIAQLAKEHGLPSEIVDGNDVFAVYSAAQSAVQRARAGEGPQFLECRTYRWLGHVGPNDDIDKGLRSYDELVFWKKRCPIQSLETWILNKGMMTQTELMALHNHASKAVDQAEKLAVEDVPPSADTLFQNVYYGEAAK